MSACLQDRFRNAIKRHIRRQGLVTAPEELIGHLLTETVHWIKEEAALWAEDEDGAPEAEALKQLLRIGSLRDQ